MRLSSLTKLTKNVTLSIEGETLNLKVRPNVMTPAKEVALNEAMDSGNPADAVEGLMSFFCEFIAEWDIVDDDNNLIPLNPSLLADIFPSGLIMTIMQKAIDAARESGN